MIPEDKLRFRKGDLLAIGFVALLAVSVGLCFLPGSRQNASQAQIYQNGELLRTVSLSEPMEFIVDGRYSNTITVRDGKIGIAASDCPGEDCVHSGFISAPNRSVVCLPNAVEIRIVADEEAEVDFVVR